MKLDLIEQRLLVDLNSIDLFARSADTSADHLQRTCNAAA
jgi:hypothetical protein